MRPSTLVAFDGQSLNHSSPPNTYPAMTMAGRGLPWVVPAISGRAWSTLDDTAATRLHPLPKAYQRSVLILLGGQHDIAVDGDTAATALADMEAYANAARTAGFDAIIACTLTPAATWYDAGDDETQRLAFNGLIRASSAWEEVADIAAHPDLQNPDDVTYYYDGLHLAAAGNAAVAEYVGAALDAVLATL